MTNRTGKTATHDIVLPASMERVDDALVEEAAAEIRDILQRTVHRGMEEIGRYLLETFYDGDPDLYFSVQHGKHASLSSLAQRCETWGLPVKKTFLANALRVAAVSEQLPSDAPFHQLPASHRVELVRVRKRAQMEKLAERVAKKSLTVEKTRKLVRQVAQKHKSNVGRKPVPSIIRAIAASERLLIDRDTGELAFDKSDVSGLTDEQKYRAREVLQRLEDRVKALRRIVGRDRRRTGAR